MPLASHESSQPHGPDAGSTARTNLGQRTGYPFERLASAFDRVRNARDWRAPIEAVIPEADRPLVEQAIVLFTETVPTFVPATRPGHLLVRAQGYGMSSTPGPVTQTRPGATHSRHDTAGLSQGANDQRYLGFPIIAQSYKTRRFPLRRILYGSLALLLIGSLTAFAFSRIDGLRLLRTIGDAITTLMVLVVVAIVAHASGRGR